MTGNAKCWLATTAADGEKAARAGLPCAWLAYRVSEEGRLQRAPAPMEGGIMGLVGGLPGGIDWGRLGREIAAECSRRGFSGVFFDHAGHTDPQAFSALCADLGQKGLTLFAYPGAAQLAQGAKVIISSALGGGSFGQMLQEAAARYGPQNLCLEIERMCHDFTMPAYNPQGRRLTAAQLRAIIQEHGPTPWYNPDMQCRYFTYRGADGAHFVLFDDADSARAKLDAAFELGFYGGFLLFGEWGAGAAAIYG